MSGALEFCLFCLSLYLRGNSAFNLDVTETVLKRGENSSFFGFSVALHQQLNPQPISWLLVGAPQAAALPGQKAKRTGGLYACPLTHETKDCERVPIDEGVDLKKESKENQWLGVTVNSQGPGGKIVTCAHLYEARNRVNETLETRDVIGRCYVLSEGLQVADELDGGEWKFCEGRYHGHERFGFCQQGIATGFTADRHYILFGAPGTYNWKGTIRAELSGLDFGQYDDGPYEAGGEKDQDPSLIPLPANSYLGFSLDSGVGITRKNELSFVTGAPRANHIGSVVILHKDNVNRLVPEVILPGEKLTSSFGYSLAVVDLNHDGWMDLVVGAPNFFDRKERIGGAVYVYINQAGRWENILPIRLNGSYDSLFGIVVGAIGDLNQDGFQDFAVGAPVDGDGKVYIYHGSNLGIVTKPAQILTGESVGIKMFGYSFSGGLDIDGNFYPDLLVGSLSDAVVLYRSRPVIHISRNITANPQNVDLENVNCRYLEGICSVEVQACFIYTANPPSYSPPIRLEYSFEADGDHRQQGKASRVFFRNRKAKDLEHQYSGTLELPKQQSKACTKATLQLKEQVRDKLHPIAVMMSYHIKHGRSRRQIPGTTLGTLSPVLNALPHNSQRIEVNFLKQGCGEDKICQSNLQLKYKFHSRVDDAVFQPLPRGDDGLDVFSMSDQKGIALGISITNFPSIPDDPQRDGDDAHEAMLLISLPPTLTYASLRHYNATEKIPSCVSNQNATYVECELGNPMKRGAQFRFYLVLSTSGITLETTELEVNLELTTISEQPGLAPVAARARVIMELPLSITGLPEPKQLFFSGVVQGESAMKKESDVGSPVSFSVTVSNRGQSLSTLGSAFLYLMWPYEISNGKWLLYPLKLELLTQFQHRSTCTPEPNPLGLTLELPPQGRKKRETEQAEMSSPSLTYWKGRKNATLDCVLGTARCLLYQCPLYSFDRSAVLTIWARLWNSTFLEEFAHMTSVEVIVRANISVSSTIRNLVLKDATTQIPVTVYLDPAVALTQGVPWWIILIAVLAGILVLGLLVSILWKLGFFKRAHYEKAKIPQYHAVKIPRQERQLFHEEKTGTITKKDWVTSWSGDSDGHVPLSA
ncbi:integrin alpha-7 isoform X1 [Python bivittatus]|uniref:Integrin alpha-7 isoform X1 n=1 Tax=Python bivittatus TaxID=176946 RepID=A0A9F2R4H5_PYTBI|nr:integrin alpha-7 isoform X1 [Python bivittatus]